LANPSVQLGKAKEKFVEEDEEDDLDDEEKEEEGEPKPIVTTFEMNDTLYAEAELEDSDTVYLWLGVSLIC
jgi:hypothetical protein